MPLLWQITHVLMFHVWEHYFVCWTLNFQNFRVSNSRYQHILAFSKRKTFHTVLPLTLIINFFLIFLSSSFTIIDWWFRIEVYILFACTVCWIWIWYHHLSFNEAIALTIYVISNEWCLHIKVTIYFLVRIVLGFHFVWHFHSFKADIADAIANFKWMENTACF